MIRTDIINMLIRINGYRRYLEIGVRKNGNFNNIVVFDKDGVDPGGRCKYPITSDEFFSNIEASSLYDIIFIDGLHIKDQVLRDINNSLNHLSQGGTIVVHDCNPLREDHALETYKKTDAVWNGTVWEAWAELRMSREDLSMYVVDTDYGCGIIRRGKQKLFPREPIKYALLASNRKEILNLISAGDFIDICKKMERR